MNSDLSHLIAGFLYEYPRYGYALEYQWEYNTIYRCIIDMSREKCDNLYEHLIGMSPSRLTRKDKNLVIKFMIKEYDSIEIFSRSNFEFAYVSKIYINIRDVLEDLNDSITYCEDYLMKAIHEKIETLKYRELYCMILLISEELILRRNYVADMDEYVYDYLEVIYRLCRRLISTATINEQFKFYMMLMEISRRVNITYLTGTNIYELILCYERLPCTAQASQKLSELGIDISEGSTFMDDSLLELFTGLSN